MLPLAVQISTGVQVGFVAKPAVRIEDPEFTQIVPAQYHADLVLTLSNDAPVMGLVVEVQRRLANSEDAAEGVRSFVERRAARFTGR